MKTLKLLIAAALLTAGTTASAQLTNTQSKPSTASWNTLYLQWNPSSFSPDKGDNESFTGFTVGYNRTFSISKKVPLFIEAGVGLQYSFKSKDIIDDYIDKDDVISIEQKFSVLSMKVPVSLMYDWQIPNSKVAITPYAGIDFRFNILGKLKYDISGDYADAVEDYIKEYYDDNNILDDRNLFDKDDMGSDSNAWKRFQIGWHIGVNARFSNKYLIGISYGQDFSEIVEKAKIRTTSITLGYCF